MTIELDDEEVKLLKEGLHRLIVMKVPAFVDTNPMLTKIFDSERMQFLALSKKIHEAGK